MNVAGCCLPPALYDDDSNEDIVIFKLVTNLSIKIWNVYDNFGKNKQRKRYTWSSYRYCGSMVNQKVFYSDCSQASSR